MPRSRLRSWSNRLGVDPERVKFIQGDTDAVAFGMGTGGSRSTP